MGKKTTPDDVRFRGTCGRIDSGERGKADVIRVPTGPEFILRHPDAAQRAIEIAIQAHGISRILLEGPWIFHSSSAGGSMQLHRHFEDKLEGAKDLLERRFPSLSVATRFDDELFARTDWGGIHWIRAAYQECMDPRLDWLISRIRNKHGEAALIARLPGGSAAIEDPIMREALVDDFGYVVDYLLRTHQQFPRLKATTHEDCAYLKARLPDVVVDEDRHRTVVRNIWPILLKKFSRFYPRANVLQLDGTVLDFPPNPAF